MGLNVKDHTVGCEPSHRHVSALVRADAVLQTVTVTPDGGEQTAL